MDRLQLRTAGRVMRFAVINYVLKTSIAFWALRMFVFDRLFYTIPLHLVPALKGRA
jgi:hypothetical protein